MIDVGAENPGGLLTLRAFPSSKEMLTILDDAESILDPRGTGARETYGVAEEPSRFYQSKIETEKAISYFKTALEVATPFNWHDQLFWTRISLVKLFRGDGRFEGAQAHIEHARPYTTNGPYYLAHAVRLQANVRCKQHRLEGARSEALRAANGFERSGAL